jgi:hypothetical protein
MAMALAGVTAAQNEQDQQNKDQDQQQQSSDQSDRERDSERDQQDRDRQQQDQQRDQRQRDQPQRDQQNQQRDQQSQQWDQQNRERSQQSQWDESRTGQRSQRESASWPQPTRYQSDQYGGQRQTQYESYGQRPSSGYEQGSDQQAGLGVFIVSDGGGRGVRVTEVSPGSPAEEMGLRTNDRITHLNGQQVTSEQEFISRIRNMNPGDEVELEVLRDQNERIVRGELESRQEALVLSNRRQDSQRYQQGDEGWQTGYQEGGYGYQQQSRTRLGERAGDFSSRLNSIEQQVNRLSRELEQVRFALQDLRQGGQGGRIGQFQRGGETQAGYDDYQSGRYQQGRIITGSRDDQIRSGEFRSEGTWQGDTFRDGSQSQRFQGSRQSGEFGRSSGGQSSEGGTDSEGGVTGGLRTRPQNDQNWSDRQ